MEVGPVAPPLAVALQSGVSQECIHSNWMRRCLGDAVDHHKHCLGWRAKDPRAPLTEAHRAYLKDGFRQGRP